MATILLTVYLCLQARVAEEMGNMEDAEKSRRVSLTATKVGSSRSSPPMNPKTDKDFHMALGMDPFIASSTEIQVKHDLDAKKRA